MISLHRKNLYLLCGAVIFSIIAAVPRPSGLTNDGQLMIGLFVLAAWYWVSEALPLPVTALLIMLLLPILGIMSSHEVFASFGNHAVFFLIGAFIIATALQVHNIHKRMALYFLHFFHGSPRTFILGIMATGALISFIIPEHAVVVLLLPIILVILQEMNIAPRESNFGRTSMIAIAFGCSIGSLATPLGGARNPLAIAFLDETVGVELTFLDWMSYSLPIVILCLPLSWFLLMRSFPPEKDLDLSATKSLVESKRSDMEALGPNELKVIGILLLTISLWIFASGHINIAVIALIGSTLLFVTNSITWKQIESMVPWGIIILYGGAITLGAGMETSGAASWIALKIIDVVGSNPYHILFILITATICITNMISNTASVAMLLPIGFGFSQEILELTPLLTTLTIALSGGLAFMLIIATPGNIITYSAGYYSQKDLVKAGLPINIASIFIIYLVAVTYWKWIGVW